MALACQFYEAAGFPEDMDGVMMGRSAAVELVRDKLGLKKTDAEFDNMQVVHCRTHPMF